MKMRVWWIPQAGETNEPFYIPVHNVEEARKILDILGAYDAYQLQNNIKPDYCNVGGLEVYNEETEDWEDWYIETENDYFDDVDEYIDSLDNAKEFQEFTEELYKQIDLDVI